ncbi:endothelin-converting enzyme 1-like protein 3, partial [Leptotrombidium deliense]
MKIGRASSTDVEKYANAVVEYEKRIARFTPSIEKMQSLSSFQHKRISDLKQDASRIRWNEFLQKVYPHGNIKDLTIITVQFLEYFKEVSHIVTTSDNVGLSDYLVWRYIFANLPDVAMKIGRASSTGVEKYANTVVEYEKRIAKLTPAIEKMQSPSSFQNKRISDLKQDASRI